MYPVATTPPWGPPSGLPSLNSVRLGGRGSIRWFQSHQTWLCKDQLQGGCVQAGPPLHTRIILLHPESQFRDTWMRFKCIKESLSRGPGSQAWWGTVSVISALSCIGSLSLSQGFQTPRLTSNSPRS